MIFFYDENVLSSDEETISSEDIFKYIDYVAWPHTQPRWAKKLKL